VTPPLDPLAARLLQLLPSDGGSMGNSALQRLLEEVPGQPIGVGAFTAARDTLLAVGAVTKGRGRGGSLHLSDGMRAALADAPAISLPATMLTPARAAHKALPAKLPFNPPTRASYMLTGELRSKIDAIWNAFWSGGIANPIEVIEQITYLLFLRRLDDLQLLAENKANRLNKPIERRIFPEGKDDIGKGGGIAYDELRWSHFKNAAPAEMYAVVSEHVFPFLRTLGGDDSTYAHHMKDARFTIPTPALLAKVVDLLDQVPMEDRDTKGDLYEYMLGKIASAGQNGQFRTPRHIIQLMVAITAPQPNDIICDPACGTAGFLVAAGEYLRDSYPQLLHNAKQREHFHRDAFHGFDFDNTMLRIGSMNMLLHGVENPDIRYRDSLAQENGADEEAYTLLLANPPFAGSLDYENTAKNLLDIVKTKKTELLFLALFLRLLKTGGRAAVIVPDGVLFGSSKAHKELRRRLVEEHKLDAVISLPGGVFKPYAGVSTAILLFTKTNAGGTDHVWFYDVQADGWSLDDKRNQLLGDEKLGVTPATALGDDDHAKYNLPDVLARWSQRGTSERERPRTAQSFCVAKADIAAQGYDLSLNRYKELVHEEVAHRAPQEILAGLTKLEAEIALGMKELEGMLE
jgi:type I restriction enzyme M protein